MSRVSIPNFDGLEEGDLVELPFHGTVTITRKKDMGVTPGYFWHKIYEDGTKTSGMIKFAKEDAKDICKDVVGEQSAMEIFKSSQAHLDDQPFVVAKTDIILGRRNGVVTPVLVSEFNDVLPMQDLLKDNQPGKNQGVLSGPEGYIPLELKGIGESLFVMFLLDDADTIGKDGQNKGFTSDGRLLVFDAVVSIKIDNITKTLFSTRFTPRSLKGLCKRKFKLDPDNCQAFSILTAGVRGITKYLFDPARHIQVRNLSVLQDSRLSQRVAGLMQLCEQKDVILGQLNSYSRHYKSLAELSPASSEEQKVYNEMSAHCIKVHKIIGERFGHLEEKFAIQLDLVAAIDDQLKPMTGSIPAVENTSGAGMGEGGGAGAAAGSGDGDAAGAGMGSGGGTAFRDDTALNGKQVLIKAYLIRQLMQAEVSYYSDGPKQIALSCPRIVDRNNGADIEMSGICIKENQLFIPLKLGADMAGLTSLVSRLSDLGVIAQGKVLPDMPIHVSIPLDQLHLINEDSIRGVLAPETLPVRPPRHDEKLSVPLAETLSSLDLVLATSVPRVEKSVALKRAQQQILVASLNPDGNLPLLKEALGAEDLTQGLTEYFNNADRMDLRETATNVVSKALTCTADDKVLAMGDLKRLQVYCSASPGMDFKHKMSDAAYIKSEYGTNKKIPDASTAPSVSERQSAALTARYETLSDQVDSYFGCGVEAGAAAAPGAPDDGGYAGGVEETKADAPDRGRSIGVDQRRKRLDDTPPSKSPTAAMP